MALTPPVRLSVEDVSGVAPARRAAEDLASGLGFDEHRRGEVAIVVTELATNLVRHGRGGEILLRRTPHADAAIDAIAWDRGPGMRDVAQSRRDGFSTVGGAGTGLGAVGRLSATFDLQSTANRGTVLVARLGAVDPPDVDGLAVAMKGEEVSGDAWDSLRQGSATTVLLADGLGHGGDAALAAAAAVRELRADLAPEEQLARMHAALRPTRGAAAAIARLDDATGALRFAGIGNIAAAVVGNGSARSLASMNGTLGHRVERIHAYDHRMEPGDLLVLHSDGCRGGWDLSEHPGLVRRDPLVIASLLLRDFERGRDDASVVVARHGGSAAS
ncbi:MAG: ATP-binding protein [Solirubrobacteraceae bacterium]